MCGYQGAPLSWDPEKEKGFFHISVCTIPQMSTLAYSGNPEKSTGGRLSFHQCSRSLCDMFSGNAKLFVEHL